MWEHFKKKILKILCGYYVLECSSNLEHREKSEPSNVSRGNEF